MTYCFNCRVPCEDGWENSYKHFVMALVCSLLTCCLYPVLMTCLSVSTLQQINLIILLHVHNLLLPVFASSSLSKSCFVNQATWLCSGWFCTCRYCFSPSSLAPTRLLCPILHLKIWDESFTLWKQRYTMSPYRLGLRVGCVHSYCHSPEFKPKGTPVAFQTFWKCNRWYIHPEQI